MSQKQASGSSLPSSTITSDDILGKDVIDIEGQFLGVVEKIHVNANTLDIVGLSVDKGFLKKGLMIGKGYVKRITDHAVFLKIKPAFNMKGMTVFDKIGKKVGVVKEVQLYGSRNQVKCLIVRSHLFSREMEIPADLIENVGHNIFLKDLKESLTLEMKESHP